MFIKNDIINKKFKVLFPIQNTTYGSSYRVQGLEDGNIYMLKIYEKERLEPWHYNVDGELIEAEIHKKLSHVNISNFVSCESITFQNQELFDLCRSHLRQGLSQELPLRC